MMTSGRRWAVGAAAVALIGLSAGCTSTKNEAPAPSPTTTTTTPSTEPTVAPSEKRLDPTESNKFTPTHIVLPTPPTGHRH